VEGIYDRPLGEALKTPPESPVISGEITESSDWQ